MCALIRNETYRYAEHCLTFINGRLELDNAVLFFLLTIRGGLFHISLILTVGIEALGWVDIRIGTKGKRRFVVGPARVMTSAIEAISPKKYFFRTLFSALVQGVQRIFACL
jgi:hypothetical protein